GEPFSTSGGVSDVHYVLAAEWTATDDTLNLAIDSSKAKIHGYTLHSIIPEPGTPLLLGCIGLLAPLRRARRA
ncbi:MAG: hypothetical protein O3A92_17375, partial [Verrucomicrobia bacterium]|nr:hypothetical protein [Verrucomicrobiota bacterium]